MYVICESKGPGALWMCQIQDKTPLGQNPIGHNPIGQNPTRTKPHSVIHISDITPLLK